MSKYLYNGLELPALPEWDKTAYPYAYIYYLGETPTICSLVLIPAEAEIVYDEATSAILFSTPHYLSYYIESNDDQWDDAERTETSDTIYLYKPMADFPENYIALQWTNFNVYTKNGDLLLPAIDPVPINGRFPLKSWMTGLVSCLVGKPLSFVKSESTTSDPVSEHD